MKSTSRTMGRQACVLSPKIVDARRADWFRRLLAPQPADFPAARMSPRVGSSGAQMSDLAFIGRAVQKKFEGAPTNASSMASPAP